MKKIKALISYELINLKRSPLIWVIIVLYIFGEEQALSAMNLGGGFSISLLGYIKNSWLPLNMIMIPLLLVNTNIGGNKNEVFETIDISNFDKRVAKFFCLSMFNGVILLINLLIFVSIAILCKVSFGYFVYLFLGYTLNTFIFLLVCTSIGLFVGEVIYRNLGNIIGYIVDILLFLMLCNFYKEGNNIVPLIDLRTVPFSFDVITYNKGYYYHNILWIVLAILLVITPSIFKFRKKEKPRARFLRYTGYFSLCSISIYLTINIIMLAPNYYGITIKDKHLDGDKVDNTFGITSTYYARSDCGYYVDKYKMDMNIGEKFQNNCEMEVKIDKNSVKTLEFGLYEKLIISQVGIDEQKIDYGRTNRSFYIKLPKEYSKGDTVKVKLQYKGIINTVWDLGREFFHSRSNSIFLADVFEWYPKLNDEKLKQYNVNIKYAGAYKIYSNINCENNENQYRLSGEDKDIFLISNRMVERKYMDYLIVGNEELVKDEDICKWIITRNKTTNGTKPSTIILGPAIPGETDIKSKDSKIILTGLN